MMPMSNLIEISEKGSLILKPLATFEINGHSYEANKLFYAHADCGIQFQYSNTMAIANQGPKGLLANQKISLRHLAITHLPLTTKLLSFYKREYEGGLRCPIIETKLAGPGLIILNKEPILESIQIIDSDIMFTYNEEFNAIESDEFEEDVEYNIYYEVEQMVSTFNLNDYSPDYPYFSADIIMQGNYNKETRDFHIHIPRVALQMSPAIDLMSSSVSFASMNLHPLDTEVLLTMVV
jgi:hypothetical protein